MSAVVLTVVQFRADFPEFASAVTYPDATLETFIARAYLYVSQDGGEYITDETRLLAIEYMVAHLQTISSNIAAGGAQGGLVGASSVGSVSVTLIPPVIKSQFSHWMNQTAYGQQFLALLGAHSPAGFYRGGSSQRVFR